MEFRIRTILAANIGLYFGLSLSEQRLPVFSIREELSGLRPGLIELNFS